MARIFGFDIGTTSIGWAVIDQDEGRETGRIAGMGVRIFPEARDPDGTPLNQTRRLKRMMRRQLRRRRDRRKTLNLALADAGLLPGFSSEGWATAMGADSWAIREKGLTERLDPHELGRALYHLSKRRHFRGRDLEETESSEENADEKAAANSRESFIAELRSTGKTIGALLASGDPHTRKRGVQAERKAVKDEFERLWTAQVPHHPTFNETLKAHIGDIIFAQKPVFWRINTLGVCRLTGERPSPKASWASQQRRMLEMLSNVRIVGGNERLLDPKERALILTKLQTQNEMSWTAVRSVLKPLYKARNQPGEEARLIFNLEIGTKRPLLGNPLEAKLARIFGGDWANHPNKQAIRDAIAERLRRANFYEIGNQRVVLLAEADRARNRVKVAREIADDFGLTPQQAEALSDPKLMQSGWEAFSLTAIEAFMPHLESGVTMGALLKGPEWEQWRKETFPFAEPTGEEVSRLPSPRRSKLPNGEWDTSEEDRLKAIRNPTVVRTQNELRKVINNLIRIDRFGKPDLIRVEIARDVGQSKLQREETFKRNNARRRERAKIAERLREIGVPDDRSNIEKFLLWEECGHFCPYSNLPISCGDLFGNTPMFEVEHIWPRATSLDNSLGNKTLCHRDRNRDKAKRTPFEAFGQSEEWSRMKANVWKLVFTKKMQKSKAFRFCREEPLNQDFTSRQLIDTSYSAKLAIDVLKRLWPDVGDTAPVNVQAVSGRVTGQLRHRWELNNILNPDGEKTRADHRHHAVDALVVACAHPGMTKQLSLYLQAKVSGRIPQFPPPWPGIRRDADVAVKEIIVSHRVRKKVSGPLHKETTYGDTGEDVKSGSITYRVLVERTSIQDLSLADIEGEDLATDSTLIRDTAIRQTLRAHLSAFDGDLKRAMSQPPKLNGKGPEIRKVRLQRKRQLDVMRYVHNGLSDPESKHHIAIYRKSDGTYRGPAVSVFDVAKRIANRQTPVDRSPADGSAFIMSLAKGDILVLPDPRARYWVVRELKSNGQVTLVPHTEARPTKQAINYKPTTGGLMALEPRKISVDPIGRIRPAND